MCIFASVFVFPAVAPHFHDWDICHFAFAHRQQASTSSSSVKTSNGTFLKMRESVVNMMGQGENGYKLKMVGRVGEPDDGHWMQIISLLSSSKHQSSRPHCTEEEYIATSNALISITNVVLHLDNSQYKQRRTPACNHFKPLPFLSPLFAHNFYSHHIFQSL